MMSPNQNVVQKRMLTI